MTRVYIPSVGPDSWQQFPAEPEKQWKTGYSAKSLAYSWEEADGFPAEIQRALADFDVDELKDIQPLRVIPEHKVPLPGGSTASQNDAFVLGSGPSSLVSICMEGEVNESFGEPISKWAPDSSPGSRHFPVRSSDL